MKLNWKQLKVEKKDGSGSILEIEFQPATRECYVHFTDTKDSIMQGDADSRHSLGTMEFDNKKYDRAVRHFLISAKMGHKESLDEIKEMFAKGHATKAQYAEGLKGFQEAMEEMKSPDRDEELRYRN